MARRAAKPIVADTRQPVTVQLLNDDGSVVERTLYIDDRWNIMPPLSSNDYERLLESLEANNGIIPGWEPTIDEFDTILDGHHRIKGCNQLGIPVRLRWVTHLNDIQKQDFVWATNVPRRHLTITEKRELVRKRLLQRPEGSNIVIAKDVGLTDKTVDVIRTRMEDAGEIPHTIPARGRPKDGSEHTTPRIRVVNTEIPEIDEETEEEVDEKVDVPAADHRRMCFAEIRIGYAAPSEIERKRGQLPFERESVRLVWFSNRMYLQATAPRNLDEAQKLMIEAASRAIQEISKRPLRTMLQ